MGLSYFPITGRLVLTDSGPGAVIFDTDDAMLVASPNDLRSGYVAVPERLASSSGVNGNQTVVDVETDYYIGTPEVPGANVARGAMRVTWASDPEPTDGLWRQATGTHLDLYDGASVTTVGQDDVAGLGYPRISTIGGYTFFVNELGHLVLRERLVIRARDSGNPPANINRTRRAATIEFRLLVGFFFRQDFKSYPAVQWRGQVASGNTLATQTVTCDFGYAFPGRRLVAFIFANRGGGGTQTPTGVSIGGVAATIHGAVVASGNTDPLIAIASASVPTGETGNVVVTFPSSGNGMRAQVIALKGLTNSVPLIATQALNSASSTSMSVTTDDKSCALVACHALLNAPSAIDLAWSQAEALPKFPGGIGSARVLSKGGARSVGANWGVTGSAALLSAVFY